MNKGVVAYLIVFAVIIVVAVLFFMTYKPSKATTTVPRTTTSPTTTVKGTTSVNTTAPPQTTVHFSSCLSYNATESIPNGNFVTGNYQYWSVSGPAFGTAPFNITFANSNSLYYSGPWRGYNGTYFATSYSGGLSRQPGNITSSPFTVNELYLDFQIVSPQSNQLYIEILEKGAPVLSTHFNTYVATGSGGNASSTFVNATIPLGTLLCQTVQVRVVSGTVGISNQFNFIAVGDFYLSSSSHQTAGIVVNTTS